ncbi:MAG: CYCXC family (seleno)protein [Terriglobales bacterium]
MKLPGAVFIVLLGLGVVAAAQQPQPTGTLNMALNVVHEAGVPPFHKTPTAKEVAELPPTLNPAQFSDPRVRAAYAMAAQIRAVLYQEPCYCGCDKEAIHHKSLFDCFAGLHASICQTCMMEGVYAYRQTKQGKTPAQIRAGIEHGAWRSINLNDLLLGTQVY